MFKEGRLGLTVTKALTKTDSDALLDRVCGGPASPEDIELLFAMSDEDGLSRLFEAARRLRRRHFGDRVFLYGFNFFSTHCRNDCLFCNFRKSQPGAVRYRKSADEILAAASMLAETGVHLIDLTMGEDPAFYRNGGERFDELADLTAAVKERTGLAVMVSPGAAPNGVIPKLAAAGADWYACYQETHTRDLFARLRPGQDFDERLNRKREARSLGMLVEEGILTGVGDTPADVAESISRMDGIEADQLRVMTFVPQEGTPLANLRAPSARRELVVIALLRLAFPDRLIPASLDVGGLAGLRRRLDAGANVITSLIPPGRGWAGVAHHSLDIEDSRRTVGAVRPVLEDCGLEPAALQDYLGWLDLRRRRPDRPKEAGALV
jgi:methylornithine synthase